MNKTGPLVMWRDKERGGETEEERIPLRELCPQLRITIMILHKRL